MVAAWISDCLADISEWLKEHDLQLKLAKKQRASDATTKF